MNGTMLNLEGRAEASIGRALSEEIVAQNNAKRKQNVLTSLARQIGELIKTPLCEIQ